MTLRARTASLLALAARPWALALLALGTFAVGAWLEALGECLFGSSSYRVVDLELSFDPQRFTTILLSWNGPCGLTRLRLHTLVDFLFLPAYSLLLGGFYVFATTLLRARRWRLFAVAPLLAAALDALENLAILALSLGQAAQVPSGAPVLVMSMAAALKFGLLGLNLTGLLLAGLTSRYGRLLLICRWSVASVLLGSVPLLFVPQGQDVLRAFADGDTPWGVRASGMLASLVWASCVWYWSRVLLMLRSGQDSRRERVFVTRLPRVLGGLTLGLLALAFMRAGLAPGGRRGLLLAFSGLYVVLAVAFVVFVTRRRVWLWGETALAGAAEQRFEGWSSLPLATRAAGYTSLGLSLVLLVLCTHAAVPVGQLLGTLGVLALFVANTVYFGSLFAHLAVRTRLPLVTIGLTLAAVFSVWNDAHVVRLVRDGRGGPGTVVRPALKPAFDAWLQGRLAAWDGPKPMPVFLVAAEGGGIRAAFWTASVLARLQDESAGRFAPQVLAISGVSGGSLGAATFTALVADEPGAACPDLPADGPGRGRLQRCAERALGQDFLSPVLAKFLMPDLLQWFVPFPVQAFDRGRALEDGWAVGYRRANPQSDRLGQPFLELWQAGGKVPHLFFNGTHVRSGRRSLIASVAFQPSDVPDSYDLHELLGADLSLAGAAHASARFAYISPAGRLVAVDGHDHGHVVDGGYFENSGAATIYDLWRALQVSVDPQQTRFVTLYLCNNPERCYLPGDAALSPRAAVTGAEDLSDLASPLRALLGARDARGGLALAELRREDRLGRLPWLELGACAGLIGLQKTAPLPLGWTLSQGVRAEMTAQAVGLGCPANLEAQCAVLALLGRPCAPPPAAP